jgi:glycosyltransferase involved in cell wall biosynthesis
MSTCLTEKPLGFAPTESRKHSPINSTLAVGHVVIATVNRAHGNTGVHTHTAALREGFRSEGVRCNVVTPFDNPLYWIGIFAVRPVILDRFLPARSIHWYRHWHAAALRVSLRRYLAEHHVDHIIAQCPVSAQAAMEIRTQMTTTDKPAITLVCHFNHSEAQEYQMAGKLKNEAAYQKMLAFESDVIQRVDQAVYVSDWARGIVEKDRNIHPLKSAVVHNGIPLLYESETSLSRRDISAKADDLLLINIGSLESRKNQIGLLDLFAAVHAREPRAKLLIVGDGPDANAIREKIESLGLHRRVVMLGRRTDVPSLLSLSDLYVHYSTLENCPMVILEAARAGLPWASIPVAGIVELQKLIGGCISLNPDAPKTSADAIVALLHDRDRRAALAHSAKENFTHRFTQKTMVQSYLHLLDELRPKAEATV